MPRACVLALVLVAAGRTALAVVSTGSYNLHTLGGNIVVSNVVATHFGDPASWSLLGRNLAPFWYQAVNAISAVVGAEDASQSKKADSAVHASLRAGQ